MAKASEMSWRGYEDIPKVCRVCEGKVTLTGVGGGFRAHTDAVPGVRCLGCGLEWDDENPDAVVCACLDTHGGRTVVEVSGVRWLAHHACLRGQR